MNDTDTRVYNFLLEYFAGHAYGPTLREIAAGVGLNSPSTVIDRLTALQAQGLIRWERRISRGISLVSQLGEAGGG